MKGKYVTGHPTKKDLFICDETEQESKGIDLFERITGLVVHRVTLAEMGETRVLNRNHSQAPHVWTSTLCGSLEARAHSRQSESRLTPNLDPREPAGL